MDKRLATKSGDLAPSLELWVLELCRRRELMPSSYILTSTRSPWLVRMYSLNSLSLLSLSLPFIHTINSKCKILKYVFTEHRTFRYI